MFYSLPRAVFVDWMQTAGSAEIRAEGVSHQLLRVVDDVIPERPAAEDTAFFFISNTTPETRFHLNVPHLATSRYTVMVGEAMHVASRPFASEYSVQRNLFLFIMFNICVFF